ncbi:MAG: glycosyltransferase, partial [Gammaproteobacteria bacterium]
MHIADITMFWTPSSGGVRTFLEAKDAWLAKQPGIRHTLLVPGAIAARAGAHLTLPAPPIPFGHGYRFPLRRQAWVEQLVGLAPDIIEAGDPYVLAWAALQAGRRLQVPVVGFYHSDLPRLVGSRAGQWTNRWLNAYIARLYRHFDRVLAPSQVMADKLRSLGVERVFVQSLGVDPVLFNPCHRAQAVRSELGLDDAIRLLIFAGRGSREKNLPVLLQAMTLLGKGFHLHLV